MATIRDKQLIFGALSIGGMATSVTQAEVAGSTFSGWSITGNSVVTCLRQLNPGETDPIKIAKAVCVLITDLYKQNPNNF